MTPENIQTDDKWFLSTNLKKKKVMTLSSCGYREWEGLVNETTSVVFLGFPWEKLGNLKQCILVFYLIKLYVRTPLHSFRFVTRADLFKRQLLHCKSALKTGVHWYLENLRKWTLSSGPQDVPHSSRDLHSCRWTVQFPGGHDPLSRHRSWAEVKGTSL